MDADRLAQRFDAVEPFTIGIEEEVMLLDTETLELADVAGALVSPLAECPPAPKLELPASQVELVSAPRRSVGDAIADIAAGRRALLASCAGATRPAVAGVHPFSSPEGELNRGPRYDRVAAEYGWAARRQRVCALQIHIAVGGAERTLAVYGGLRSELPALAELGITVIEVMPVAEFPGERGWGNTGEKQSRRCVVGYSSGIRYIGRTSWEPM